MFRSRAPLPRSFFAFLFLLNFLFQTFPFNLSLSFSSEQESSSCNALFFQNPFSKNSGRNASFDLSLIALSDFYGNKIEIEDRAQGPWLYLHAEAQTRDLTSFDELGIGTYNVFNLLQHRGKYNLNLNTGEQIRVREPIAKAEDKLIQQGKMIFEENNDILFVQEVESLNAAQILNEDHMQGAYRPILIYGNDTRGIHIAMFFKKDLPFDIEIQSHRNLTGDYLGQKELIFSRDLPVVFLRKKGAKKSDPPFLILMGEHLKSKRHSFSDPHSNLKRRTQIKYSLDIKEKFEAQFPNVPIVSLGDFNGDLRSDQELAAYWNRGQMKDSFDLAEKTIPKEERITHTYHPYQKNTVATQLDGVLVSKAGQIPGLIKEARIIRYCDSNGCEKPLPKNIEERDQNPSDHFMISTRWDLKRLLR